MRINNIAADNKTPLLCFHPCLPRHARQALGQEAKKQSNGVLWALLIMLFLISEINNLSAENVIETNIQATNDIYLNTLAQDVEIDSIDRQNLFVIAMLTPYVGGEGVYTARAMLGIDPEDYNLPYRIGNFGDTSQIDEENIIKVYPNPTTDKLTIEFNSDIENMQLIIYDIVGREVLKRSLKHKSSTISIQSLKSGIYFYTLSGYGTETISGKIIKQ